MYKAAVGVLYLHLDLPGCRSLKEKRGRLQPLLHRLRREFNISVAEVGLQDVWQSALLACALVGGDAAVLQQTLTRVRDWVAVHAADAQLLDDRIEIW
jgi:hypothetical protein